MKPPTLYIDPGGPQLGWVWAALGRIREAGVSRAPKTVKTPWDRANYHYAAICGMDRRRVCERMTIRGDFAGKTDKNGKVRKIKAQDICDLNLIAGRLGTEWYGVQEWKASLPADKEQLRTKDRLFPDEIAIIMAVMPESMRDHVWSAAGIFLHDIGHSILKPNRRTT
jgi:hypothetical protein